MKPRCGINPISHGWLLNKYFILSKGNFKQNKTLKNLAMGYGNLSNGQQPVGTRQISLRQNNDFYLLGNFGQALCIRLCHEDLILTSKSHNCAGIAFIQGDSAVGSKLIEQTLDKNESFPPVLNGFLKTSPENRNIQ